MIEVNRYKVVKMLTEDGNRISYDPHGPYIVAASDYEAALGREAALREDLRLANKLQTTTDAIVIMVDGQRDHWIEKHNALQQRLTVAEQRAAEMEELLRKVIDTGALHLAIPSGEEIEADICAALKSAAGCAHSFHCFGTEQKRRRCNWCNKLEAVEGEGS